MNNEYRVTYFPNGNIESEKWYKDGKLHREDGPAYMRYFRNGNIETKQWYFNGELHNTNEPATTHYILDGTIVQHVWCLNGKIHNTNGPAIIYYYNNEEESKYVINDIHIINDDLSAFLKITSLFRKKIWRYRIRKRKELLETLKLTNVYKNGSDVCRLICTYVY